MHEVGIIQSAVEAAQDSAKASGATEIHVLRLRVGALTGVVPDALEFAFEVVRSGTMAASATLEIENVPASFWCGGCQAEFLPPELSYVCPKCGRQDVELRHGLELEVASLEIS
ncbi:MAG: hydrogenase maturation nickel metallochaperone HypA [Verrucomicrobia bacterium]|nr:hydrogenase maturation nickel metallochaperone HypA [Verrucomicrobiota bacterium]